MAKRRGRVQQRIRKVPISITVVIGALATKDVIAAAGFVASDAEYLLMNVDCTYSWDSATAGDGPINVGIADGDYTDAEIEQCLEASASISLGNRIAQEQGNRLVRSAGTMTETRPNLRDGAPVKLKLNWKTAIGQIPKFYVYNITGANLVTGSALLVQGHAWIKFL